MEPLLSSSLSVSANSSTGLETYSLNVCSRTGPILEISSVSALSNGSGLTLP